MSETKIYPLTQEQMEKEYDWIESAVNKYLEKKRQREAQVNYEEKAAD